MVWIMLREILKIILKRLEKKNTNGSIKKPVDITPWLLSVWTSNGDSYGCGVCEGSFKVNDKAYLLTKCACCALFPNCFVHVDCWTKNTDKILQKKYKQNGWTGAFQLNGKTRKMALCGKS